MPLYFLRSLIQRDESNFTELSNDRLSSLDKCYVLLRYSAWLRYKLEMVK